MKGEQVTLTLSDPGWRGHDTVNREKLSPIPCKICCVNRTAFLDVIKISYVRMERDSIYTGRITTYSQTVYDIKYKVKAQFLLLGQA